MARRLSRSLFVLVSCHAASMPQGGNVSSLDALTSDKMLSPGDSREISFISSF